MFETCPLLDELAWIKHGFYDENASLNKKYLDRFSQVLSLHQTHSDKICFDQIEYKDEADASVTVDNDIALAIRTADCCPVLLVCTHSKQIAAVHAGWPGALNRITEKTVRSMIARGAKPENIIAALGPCIQKESFTVGIDPNYPNSFDLQAKFKNEAPDMVKFFQDIGNQMWLMDMPGMITQQLTECGVTQIWQSSIDTFADDRYASYRKDKTTIRNISIIAKSAS